jgi:hypothetical protein
MRDVVERSSGAYAYTATGSQLDLCNANGRVLLGHGDRCVAAAVRAVLERGAGHVAGLADRLRAALCEDLGAGDWDVRLFASESHALTALIRGACERDRRVLSVGPAPSPMRRGVAWAASLAAAHDLVVAARERLALVVLAPHPAASEDDHRALASACADRELPLVVRNGVWAYRRCLGPAVRIADAAHLFDATLTGGQPFAALCWRRDRPRGRIPEDQPVDGDAVAIAAAMATRDAIAHRAEHAALAARCRDLARVSDALFDSYGLPLAAVDAGGAFAIVGDAAERARLRRFALRTGLWLAASELQWPSFAVTDAVVVDAAARLGAACKRLRAQLGERSSHVRRPTPTLTP